MKIKKKKQLKIFKLSQSKIDDMLKVNFGQSNIP